MSTYDAMMPPTSLDVALDAAIAEENNRYLADPQAQDEAVRTAQMWAANIEAKRIVGQHGAVLLPGLATDVLAILQGTYSGAFSREALIAAYAAQVEHLR